MVVRGWSARIVAIMYAFVMTILISTYTASLTAENIDNPQKPQIDGLRDKKVFSKIILVLILFKAQ